jgi:hypothetical protein
MAESSSLLVLEEEEEVEEVIAFLFMRTLSNLLKSVS